VWQQVRRLRHKKLSMPHGAHLFNGVIQINFQQFHKELLAQLHSLPGVPSPSHEALRSGSVWRLLSLITWRTFSLNSWFSIILELQITKILWKHRIPFPTSWNIKTILLLGFEPAAYYLVTLWPHTSALLGFCHLFLSLPWDLTSILHGVECHAPFSSPVWDSSSSFVFCDFNNYFSELFCCCCNTTYFSLGFSLFPH
jgi:hypothetical protein